jgi:hypothetical protein
MFSLFNDTDDDDTRMHNSKRLIPMNQSLHLTKDRFAQILLNYVISSALNWT